MVDDCLKKGKSVQEGGAVYNFTGPQGFGIANMADGLFAVRQLVYDEKKISMKELKEALIWNYDKGLDAQSAGDIGTEILKAMKAAGPVSYTHLVILVIMKAMYGLFWDSAVIRVL